VSPLAANPESFGLYFVIGVCFGLVLTLCLLVIRISCKPRTALPRTATPEGKRLKDASREHQEDDSDDDDDDDDDDEVVVAMTPPLTNTTTVSNTTGTTTTATEVPVGNHHNHHHSQLDGALNVFTSAEELERAQRLEERERIIREIWRNGQPDILGTGTGTIGRVHYY